MTTHRRSLSVDLVHPEHTDEAVLVVAGEPDVTTNGVVLAAGREALARGARTVTVQCEGVSFFDSFAVRDLVELRAAAAETGASVQVEDATRLVQAVLRVSGLEDLLAAHPAPA